MTKKTFTYYTREDSHEEESEDSEEHSMDSDKLNDILNVESEDES